MADIGISALGAYVPRLRIDRAAIASAHRWMAPSLKGQAKGSRAFASWDEDAVTMAVEAGLGALSHFDKKIASLTLASTNLPFDDLLNASIVAEALHLPASLRAQDVGHSQRGGTSALLAGLEGLSAQAALVIASDAPRARPASVAELTNGAAAAAFVLDSENLIARFLGGASRSDYFVDHFRAAGSDYDYNWEERWIRDEGYGKLVPVAVGQALDNCSLSIGEVQHLVLAATNKAVPTALAKKIGFDGVIADQLAAQCGNAGSAHPLLMLADTIDRAAVGDTIMVIGFGQGVDVLLFQKTAEPANKGLVAATMDDGLVTRDYLRLATFAGAFTPEWGMRAETDQKTMLTEAWRANEQVTGFRAGKCRSCGTVQFPQLPYCVNPECNRPADYEQVAMSGVRGRVVTVTADWLNFYRNPPLYVGFVQFDNGARVLMEMVDGPDEGIEIGERVRMAFRIKELDSQRGYRRYFWKAIPMKDEQHV
ncbi:OB-fold domain-containing protein [Novosphingobium pentaromativorans]|uniref:Uncharacterized protein n=1 Tax=Novosphingobium pentaromativorans US6-1 TaxID=1088721 RepID=G6EGF1_9SPHN|nr:OB-fold domain-containing protein [Novosphingobium pentaromativorans]AIT82124.1 hypothetical protein JI59_21580 [Novosphingobium pentaromativorans US6-1]EHJ59602.1 hypothetical protein NSU_3485 [Novosphingobium pentaromativorans US6-1]